MGCGALHTINALTFTRGITFVGLTLGGTAKGDPVKVITSLIKCRDEDD